MLVGVDADSTYCYLLSLEDHRDADTWGVRLLELQDQGFQPEATIADAAQLDRDLAVLAAEFQVSAEAARAVLNVERLRPDDPGRWPRQAALQSQLGGRYFPLSVATAEVARPTVRASSLVENLNSRLRNYFFLLLLKVDADGPNWTDRRIAEAFSCRTKTVENIRQRLVERGFDETLNGTKQAKPPTEKLLDGEQEARIIATRLGPPPKGYANWTLRLLARKVVELEIVDSVSYETVRRTLKKTG